MNISFLTGVSALNPIKTPQRTVIRQQGLTHDTFVRTTAAPTAAPTAEKKENNNKNFDVNAIRQELSEMQTFNGKPKFKDDKLDAVTKIVSDNPEKWNAIKVLAQEPKMISSLIIDFASRDVETLNSVADLSQLKTENGEKKFSSLEIRNLANQLNGEELSKVGKLANTPLDSDIIINIAKDKNLTDMEKLAKTVNDFAKSSPDIRRVSFQKDDFDENAYNVRADMEGNGSKILLLDKDLQANALEIVNMEKSKEGYLQQVKKTQDFRNNTVSKVISMKSPSIPQPIVTEETRIIKDNNGNTVRKELYTISDLAGTPNIKYVYPDGSEKIVSSGTFDEETGKTTVKKDMTSLDGTRTEYLYEDTPDGNMASHYKITDKDGNVLMDKTATLTVVDDNTFISTENDKKYEVKISENKIDVKNLNNGEISTLNFDGRVDGNKEKLMASFKHMPAEEIIRLGDTTDTLTGIDNTYQSTYAATTRTIKSGDNLFTILHEAGHAKDYEHVDVKNKETLANSIFSNPKVNETFEAEKAKFNEAFPLAQRDHISYFIKNSEYKDGLQEAIAETNALLNTKNTEDLFSIRSQYLQQYFPKTIVLLAQMMD